MVDITAKLFWYRTKEWYRIMADKVNDIVYTDEKKETVDVINLLLLGWILLGLTVYIIGNVVAAHLRRKKSTLAASKSETADDNSRAAEHVFKAADTETKVEDSPQECTKHEIVSNIPTCDGEDQEIVEWINNVFSWIYNQRVVSPMLDSWLYALNAKTRLSSTEHGILVDFKEVSRTSSSPIVTNVLQSSNSKGDVVITCDTEVQDTSFDIVATQFKEKEKETHNFRLHAKIIAGKVWIECIPEDVSFTAKYSEAPEVKLHVENTSNNITSEEDIEALKDVVCEIASEALSSAVIDLRLSHFPECPRFAPKYLSENDASEAAEQKDEKQLLVKIIKASNLGGDQGCLKPYCVVEMDEPPQRFETQTVEEKFNPFWDESYTFIVKDISAELLFEIYDKEKPSNENFLGLGIVSVDELLRNPSQRQMIPLQSRPLEDDNVTGTLTAEFLFLNQLSPVSEPTHLSQFVTKTESPSEEGKSVETNCRVTAAGTVITTTTIKRTKEESSCSLEATPKLHANSLHSGEPILTPSHEVQDYVANENVHAEQKQVTNEIKSNISNGGNLISHDNLIDAKQISNGNLNGISKTNGKISNLVTMYETQTTPVSNTNISIDTINDSTVEKSGDLIEKTISVDNTEPQMNGIPKIACSPPHVHEIPVIIPKLPVIVIGEPNNTVGENDMSSDSDDTNVASSELHDICLNVDSNIHESKDTDENSNDNCCDLPPIATLVEFSPTSPEGLESNDAETDLTGAALKEIEKLSKPNQTSKSTLIIHSVQRPDSTLNDSLEASPASHLSRDSHTTSQSDSISSSPIHDKNSNRSRPKEKKSFMGTLKRKLSFHKTRSKSAENRNEAISSYSQASSRSASTDRIRHPSNPKQSPFKERLLGQFLHPGSTRSSLSEASGVSGLSTRTYINENSTLVIETNENGIIKRYLIPNSLVHRSKWKKKGLKLHIYNDHVFIAKHLSGSTVCQVCQKHLTRRPGKQGYECRGCNLQCHKSCHVKVNDFCSNSSVNSMEVEYVHDPKGASPKSI